MALHKVNRWVWIILGAIIGLVYDTLQRLPATSWSDTYGPSLSQIEFERAVHPPYGGRNRPLHLTVYPANIPGGDSSAKVHIVVMDSPFRAPGGTTEHQTRSFIAEQPYRPIGQGDYGSEVPSVMAFLDSIKKADPKLAYTYAWWREGRWSTVLHTGGGVLLIGILWPMLINLMTLGTLTRPHASRGLRASKPAKAVNPAGPVVSQLDLEIAAAMAAEIEKNLAVDASRAVPVSCGQPSQSIKQLANTPLPEAPVVHSPETAFGIDPDDFYPTQRHSPTFGSGASHSPDHS